jgi:hypothetical protein
MYKKRHTTASHTCAYAKMLVLESINNQQIKRSFTEGKIRQFKNQLQKINWCSILTSQNTTNTNFENFNNMMRQLLNRVIPKKKIKCKSKPNRQWLTKGIKISCKHKRLLKIFSSKCDHPILNNHCKIYGKLLKRTVSNSKKLQNIKQMEKSSNKTKEMWHIIKKQTNKVHIKSRKNIKLIIQNKLTENPTEIANEFNTFFTSVGACSNQSGNPHPIGRPAVAPRENSLYLSPVTPQEIFKIIKKLKNKRSYGIDEMPPILVKQCAQELADPLSLLINQSFEEGTFPDLLKTSIIKPILKKGSQTDCNNYRPVALLTTFSKIFETAMTTRLHSFCEKYNIFSDSQNGFRKNRSTALAAFKYIHNVLNIINSKNHAIGVLLDLSKAYDRVMHNILLKKLYDIGVRGTAHGWFTSYLTNRVQCVEVEHYDYKAGNVQIIRSEETKVSHSIPQGSVLGCVLFLIYINDLPKTISHPSTLFADDISLVIPCKDDLDLKLQLDSVLKDIITWLADHNLQVNFAKTKLLQFKPHQRQPIKIDYCFEGIPLEHVETFPLLGITIDTAINWKEHVNNITAKLNRFTYALHKLKICTNAKTATSAYYAYAHSWLTYGIVLWGNSADFIHLFRMQKRCLRIINNIGNRESCKAHFAEQKILTLPSVYILEACIFVKKNMHLFPQHSRPTNLRPRTELERPTSKLQMVHSGPFAMCVKLYNNLPNAFKNENNINNFKTQLKTYLIKKCYYSTEEYLIDKECK